MSADPLHTLDHAGPIVTLQSHVLQQQSLIPGATGTRSWILSSLSISAKIIANKVRCAPLQDVLGEAGADNVQGEKRSPTTSPSAIGASPLELQCVRDSLKPACAW